MFNVFIHERKSLEPPKPAHYDRSHRDRLANSYYNRVQKQVEYLDANPIKQVKYESPIKHIIRNQDRQKFLAHSHMLTTGFRSQQDRIQSVLRENERLDLSPVVWRQEFRTRQPGKEIRFTRSNSQAAIKSVFVKKNVDRRKDSISPTPSESFERMPAQKQERNSCKWHNQRFKSIGSLVNPDKRSNWNGQANNFAKNVLVKCGVINESVQVFLKSRRRRESHQSIISKV